MSENTAATIMNVALFAMIAFGMYTTGTAWPLLGLLAVMGTDSAKGAVQSWSGKKAEKTP